jgi:hypothetical protein
MSFLATALLAFFTFTFSYFEKRFTPFSIMRKASPSAKDESA